MSTTPNGTPFTLPALSPSQRRVLGTLIEKGLTTPEYYPLTLKALATGCNQKNNRDPIANYAETDVEEVMDQPREGQTMSRQPDSETGQAGTGSTSRPVSEVTRPSSSGMVASVTPAASTSSAGGVSSAKWEALETAVAELRQQNANLRSQMDDLRGELDDVSRQFDDLRRALGG